MTHNLLPGKKVVFHGHEVRDYPYIVLYGRNVGSYDYFIQAQLADARNAFNPAPPNAIRWSETDERWYTLDDIENPQLFMDLGLPVPNRLRYTVRVNIQEHFSNRNDVDVFADSLRAFLKEQGIDQYVSVIQNGE